MGVKRRRLGTAGALHRISRDGPFQGSRVDKRRPPRAVSRVVAGFQTRAPTWHARAAVRCRVRTVRGRGIGTSRARVPRRSSRPVRLIGVQRGSRRCLDSLGSVSSDEMSANAQNGTARGSTWTAVTARECLKSLKWSFSGISYRFDMIFCLICITMTTRKLELCSL